MKKLLPSKLYALLFDKYGKSLNGYPLHENTLEKTFNYLNDVPIPVNDVCIYWPYQRFKTVCILRKDFISYNKVKEKDFFHNLLQLNKIFFDDTLSAVLIIEQ